MNMVSAAFVTYAVAGSRANWRRETLTIQRLECRTSTHRLPAAMLLEFS
jgi:hypothetical protein